MSAVEQLRAALRDPEQYITAVESGIADLLAEANAPGTTNAERNAALVMLETMRAGIEFARQVMDRRAPVSAGKVKAIAEAGQPDMFIAAPAAPRAMQADMFTPPSASQEGAGT